MYEVELASSARQFYAKADAPLAAKLKRCFVHLEQHPRTGNNIKTLKGRFAGVLRYRVGDWRGLYRVDDRLKKVFVLDIAHRRDVYE